MELKNCPFCRSDRIRVSEISEERYAAYCQGCRSEGPHCVDEKAAITAWNTRTAPPAEGVGELRDQVFRIVGNLAQDVAQGGGSFEDCVTAVDDILAACGRGGWGTVDDHRQWLAKTLLDERLTDDEAYEIVRYSPAIKLPPPPEESGL